MKREKTIKYDLKFGHKEDVWSKAPKLPFVRTRNVEKLEGTSNFGEDGSKPSIGQFKKKENNA